MNYLVIVLRLVHVLAGVFWVGGSVLTTFFIVPASTATAEAGQNFLSHLIRRTRFVQMFSSAAGLTVLAGAALYWIDSRGLTSAWMHSGAGWGFAIGGLFGAVGFALGIQAGRAARKVGDAFAAIRGAATQGQILQLEAGLRRLYQLGIARDVFLVIALAFMATARYF